MPTLNGLRELREARNERQDDLAAALGVTQSAISQYETGLIQPSVDVLVKLADHYGVAIDRLFYSRSAVGAKR